MIGKHGIPKIVLNRENYFVNSINISMKKLIVTALLCVITLICESQVIRIASKHTLMIENGKKHYDTTANTRFKIDLKYRTIEERSTYYRKYYIRSIIKRDSNVTIYKLLSTGDKEVYRFTLLTDLKNRLLGIVSNDGIEVRYYIDSIKETEF